MSNWRTLLPNAWYIAMREYRSRIASRSFAMGTLLLAVIIFLATQIPVVIDYVGGSLETKVAIVVETSATDLPADSVSLMDQVLNGSAAQPGSTDHRQYALSWFQESQAVAQTDLQNGKFDALLIITRPAAGGDLAFTCRTDMVSDGRQVLQIQGAVGQLAIDDRLARAHLSTASVMTPPVFDVAPVKPGAAGTPGGLNNVNAEVSSTLASTALIVLIFMAIVTYGTWVAMSVAEEKGSRVMELMLNAATPFQMLTGKVLGNGAAGLTQYGAVMIAGVVGILVEGPIHQKALGGSASAPFSGLSPAVLAAFLILFLLGFLFYALLYAALGSLVSRQEDVQSATSPLIMILTGGYLASLFAIQMINDTWVVILSYVPFFSPYLMLARVAGGHVQLWEFVMAVVISLASSAVLLFVAARIYSAGVLLYGQRVGLRQVFKAARVSR